MISGNMINTPVRSIAAKVELYSGSTLVDTFNYTDKLKSLTIERVGASKFFGFGVCQKLNVKLLDVYSALEITTANSFKVYFNGVDSAPVFYVTEKHRDENSGELSITAYDALNAAAGYTVADLDLLSGYTIEQFVEGCAAKLGLGFVTQGFTDNTPFSLYYEQGANFAGTETIREALDAAAEALQCIYFINWQEQLVLRRLEPNITCLEVGKDKYFTLKSGDNRRLSAITSTNDLGDSVTASLEISGTTQFIRNNPFLEMREDVAAILTDAINSPQIGGLTVNQFELSWRGNYLLEVGDCITLITKNNQAVSSFMLDDSISYDGSFKQATRWSFEESESESESNPAELGEALNHTFARVNKAEKEIALLAGEAEGNKAAISALQMETGSIAASVTKIQEDTKGSVDDLSESVALLTNKVEAQLTSEDVKIAITTALDDGVNKVETATGFTFDERGLTVSKSNTDLSTQITEDGMKIYKDNEEVLVADNLGVNARNLHATTYLIIGSNSRFEDYEDRTGCFWIGG